MSEQNTTEYTLLDQAGELAGLVQMRDQRKYELDQLEEQIEESRAAMLEAMQANGTKKVTHPLVTVSRAQGKRSKITNQRDLINAITEKGLLHNLSPREVTKIEYDLTAAKKIGLRHEMPGVEENAYDDLKVRMANP